MYFSCKKLIEFFAAYSYKESSETVDKCEGDSKPSADHVCEFRFTKNFAPCLSEFSYGFGSEEGGPCIFLKLNKVGIIYKTNICCFITFLL